MSVFCHRGIADIVKLYSSDEAVERVTQNATSMIDTMVYTNILTCQKVHVSVRVSSYYCKHYILYILFHTKMSERELSGLKSVSRYMVPFNVSCLCTVGLFYQFEHKKYWGFFCSFRAVNLCSCKYVDPREQDCRYPVNWRPIRRSHSGDLTTNTYVYTCWQSYVHTHGDR